MKYCDKILQPPLLLSTHIMEGKLKIFKRNQKSEEITTKKILKHRVTESVRFCIDDFPTTHFSYRPIPSYQRSQVCHVNVSFLCQLTCQSADIMSSLCGVGVRVRVCVRVNNFSSKTTRPRDVLFF